MAGSRAAMFHARGKFLSDIASLVEGYGAELIEIAIERENLVLAKIEALRQAKTEAHAFELGRAGFGRCGLV